MQQGMRMESMSQEHKVGMLMSDQSAQLPSIQKGFMYFSHSVVSSTALKHRQIH